MNGVKFVVQRRRKALVVQGSDQDIALGAHSTSAGEHVMMMAASATQIHKRTPRMYKPSITYALINASEPAERA